MLRSLCCSCLSVLLSFFFFFNDTATTEIYTLSLHDALPILVELLVDRVIVRDGEVEIRYVIPTSSEGPHARFCHLRLDRKSTRLNSSHGYISYAVFCLKKKKQERTVAIPRNLLYNACDRPPR